jgi:hypothetical protein
VLRVRTLSLAVSLLSCSLAGCSSTAVSEDEENKPEEIPDVMLASTELYRPALAVTFHATDLAFNTSVPGELWVTLRQPPSGLPCTNDDDSGCDALPGAVAILSDATSEAPVASVKADFNAWHFMRRPTAIAWSDTELFATCGEARTDNLEDEPTPYAGPVLWSSDPQIFGARPTGMQNGTHLDMLHATPFCMGIAFESANAYWTFNGDAGSLDRYDFHAPHEIGGENHADGEVFRYVAGQLRRVPEVPSHLVYDAASGLIYVADTGHARLLSVDPMTATRAANPIQVYETLQDSGEMVGATLVDLSPPDLFQQPSGLALSGDTLYVADAATSYIYVLDTSGKLHKKLNTQLPSGTLGGVVVGPDGKLYFTDLSSGAVRRAELD